MKGISTKELELIKEIEEMKMNITVVTETKKNLKVTEQIRKYTTMIYSRVSAKQRAAKGVVMLIDDKWTQNSYTFIDEPIMNVMFRIPRGTPADELNACLKSSNGWICESFHKYESPFVETNL